MWPVGGAFPGGGINSSASEFPPQALGDEIKPRVFGKCAISAIKPLSMIDESAGRSVIKILERIETIPLRVKDLRSLNLSSLRRI
jgi:hypothetical protein